MQPHLYFTRAAKPEGANCSTRDARKVLNIAIHNIQYWYVADEYSNGTILTHLGDNDDDSDDYTNKTTRNTNCSRKQNKHKNDNNNTKRTESRAATKHNLTLKHKIQQQTEHLPSVEQESTTQQ